MGNHGVHGLPPAYPERTWLQKLTLPALIAVLVATSIAAVYVVMPRKRHVSGPVPEPAATATVEPLPAEGAEGVALATARALVDVYALNEAEPILVGLVRQNPRSALAHAYLARLAYRRGQTTDGGCTAQAAAAAEREVEQAEALQPGLADARLVRGYLHLYARRLGPAETLGLEAQRADPTSLRIALFLAQVAARAQRFEEAEERATALVLRVREGFVLDRAYDVLYEVYSARKDARALVNLELARQRHPGHDGEGRPQR